MATDFTSTGAVAITKNAGDSEALVSLYGDYTGLAFTFQWSPDGTNGWANLFAKDLSSNAEVSGSISPADGASVGWRIPCDNIYVRMNVTAITGGTGTIDVRSANLAPSAPTVINNIADTSGLTMSNTAVSTVGAATLAAAAIVGGVITRTGSTAAYTDTTDTAANIIAALPSATVNQSWILTIKNNVPFNETLAAGSGVTLSGQTIIPPLSTYRGLVTMNGASTITIQCLTISENLPLPNAKFTSINVTVGTLSAGDITGARYVDLTSTNATPGTQTTRTAAQMLADIPNGVLGMHWKLRIRNTGAGTFTLAGGTGVTLTGTMTVLQNSYRDFEVTLNTATTATIQDMGSPMDVFTATVAEINQYCDESANHEVVTSTNVITAAESGKTFFLNAVAGFLSTLPAPALGLNYRFIVQTAPTSNGYTIATNSSANIIKGMVTERAGGAGVSDADADLVTLVANQSIAGDWLEFRSDGTSWFMHGMVDVAAGVTTGTT